MTKTSAIVRDERATTDEMAIVQKYEDFLNYAYPKIQNCARRHSVLRDQVLAAFLAPVEGFYAAGRSDQVSRLYLLDAQLAANRFWLRFVSHPSRKVISTEQAAVALRRLDEVGRMLGAWIGKRRKG
jgi:hypothetical protein